MSHTVSKFALIITVVCISSFPVKAQKKTPSASDALPDAIRMDIVVHQVPPAYPLEARRSRITGRGILVGLVDFKTGIVTSVKMEKSTGNTMLDQAALSAFRQWRFKRGTVRMFRTPITYTMAN